ncbi:MAG: hypothetical protein IKA00_11780, partial [Prevotella sp.]|nr:hypothetical protein [Prevotella sp.]
MKSSLYNHIRILLISLFTLVANCAAWGQEFDGVLVEGAYEQKIYVKSSVLSSNTSYSIDLWQYIDLICSELSRIDGKAITRQSITDDEGLYIRWNIENKSNEVQTNHNWSIGFDGDGNSWPYGNNNGIYYWFDGFDGWLNIEYTGDKQGEWPNKILTARVKLPYNVTYSDYNDYQVVCYITNEHDGCNGSYSFSSEPNNLKIKFTVVFNETGEAPVDPFENVPNELTSTQGTKDIYEYTAPTNITINLKDYNNSITAPSYIRWCFADNNGNVVDNPGFDLTVEGVEGKTHEFDGISSIYFGGTTTNANENLLNITVTPQAGKNFADLASYKLVAYLSNESGTIENEALTKEPLISSKYEISFNFVPFASELPEASKRHTSTIIVNDENATSVSLPLSEHWETIKDDLGSETVNYLRYYLLDASDNVVTTGSLSSDKGINFENNNIIGNYWLKPSETAFEKDMLDFTATVTLGKIYDYKFVVLLSSNEATYTDGTWSKEPTLQSMFTYTVKYVDPNFDGHIDNEKGNELITKYVTEDKSIILTELYEHYITGIDGFKLKDLFANNTPVYRRFYIRNKETKQLLPNQDEWLKIESGAESVCFVDKQLGNIWSNKYGALKNPYYNPIYSDFNNSGSPVILKQTISIPEGNTLSSLLELEVVAVLSASEERTCDYTDLSNPIIELGPETHQVEYVFQFEEPTFTSGVEPAKEITILKLVENDAKSVTLNLYDDMITDIKSKYTAEEMQNFYLKWYLRDKETKEPYLPVNCPFAYTTGYSLEYLHNYGLTWCSNGLQNSGLSWVSGINNSGYTDDNLKKVFNDISYSSTNLPEGKNINDYEIVCVMTNDLSGLVEQGEYRLKEPAFQHKYVYQLITEDEAKNAFTEGSVANVKTIKKELLVPEVPEGTKDLSLTDIEF